MRLRADGARNCSMRANAAEHLHPSPVGLPRMFNEAAGTNAAEDTAKFFTAELGTRHDRGLRTGSDLARVLARMALVRGRESCPEDMSGPDPACGIAGSGDPLRAIEHSLW
jgi:hypothetical protein